MDKRVPTLSDVARRAGVSYATADRVVNGRGGVAQKSATRVHEAIAALGYVRNVAAANLAQRRTYRFVAILPSGSNAFFGRIRSILERARAALERDRVNLRVLDVAAFDPEALADRLSELLADDIDGVALVGSDDARVGRVIAALKAEGIAVLTLVSDVPGAPRDFYVGIDNAVAGRTAGRMVALAHGGRPGRVLPIIGAASARDHAERLDGLRDTLARHFPDLSLAPEIEGRDRHEQVEARLAEALKADPGITAIYSAGAGNSGLLRVIEALPAGRPRPIVVLHELVAHSRRALERGLIDVVIDQRPEEEVTTALSLLRNIADRRIVAPAAPILPAIYVNENLPPLTGPAPEGARTT